MNIIKIKDRDLEKLFPENIANLNMNISIFWHKYTDFHKLTFNNAIIFDERNCPVFQFDIPETLPGYCFTEGIYIPAIRASIPVKWRGHLYAPEVYIQPIIKSGHLVVNRYPSVDNEYDDFWDICDEKVLMLESLTIRITNILDFIERKTKIEKHVIKKLQPTPLQIQQATKNGKSYKSKSITVKDISIQYVYEPHETQKRNYHCEAWSVRGHIRHYKSGKSVYISPYTKGKGRLKDTTYLI